MEKKRRIVGEMKEKNLRRNMLHGKQVIVFVEIQYFISQNIWR